MATLFMIGVLLPMAVAVVGVLLHGRDVNRLRRFVPGSFDSGVTILAEPVAVNQVAADPNVHARLHHGEIFFLRRSLSAGFSEFPAGRIVDKHRAPYVQVRLSRGSALFHVGALTFLTFVAVWSRSWIAALLSTAMVCSILAMVARERRWAAEQRRPASPILAGPRIRRAQAGTPSGAGRCLILGRAAYLCDRSRSGAEGGMKRISSKMTFFYKKVLPVVSFGFVALLVLGLGIDMVTGERWTLTRTLLGPCLVVWMVSALPSALAVGLVDEVVDEGEHLLVRRGTHLERIALADISEVSEPMVFRQPRRVTLKLTKAGKLGREITFAPAEDFASDPLSRSDVATDLVQRVAAARAERAG